MSHAGSLDYDTFYDELGIDYDTFMEDVQATVPAPVAGTSTAEENTEIVELVVFFNFENLI